MKKFLEKDKYIEQTEDKMDAGDTYKKNYNGKIDAKARKEGRVCNTGYHIEGWRCGETKIGWKLQLQYKCYWCKGYYSEIEKL